MSRKGSFKERENDKKRGQRNQVRRRIYIYIKISPSAGGGGATSVLGLCLRSLSVSEWLFGELTVIIITG
jgi:hypothetical protein